MSAARATTTEEENENVVSKHFTVRRGATDDGVGTLISSNGGIMERA